MARAKLLMTQPATVAMLEEKSSEARTVQLLTEQVAM